MHDWSPPLPSNPSFYLISKPHPSPVPRAISTSPVLSSVASDSSDESPVSNKRRRLLPPPKPTPTRRYRPILPAPPKPNSSPPSSFLTPYSPPSRSSSIPSPFLHTPTDLPPKRYPVGQDSPFRPEKLEGNIPGSMLDTLPLLEARFDRLELAIAKYAEARAQRALRNSIVEGLDILE